ncbi:putative Clr5 domain-containing protein [Seiridium unicorne]|uniref:Clr5 domain-containing protein n=1 Tax=Seiridium unicorne TaxID=138068 RepID=A0ABR2USM5_9PEZI
MSASSITPQRQWARLEDWEPHKEKISSLYWDEDRPLKEVAEIMRRDHGFHATEKMYKARLKKWGLTKYLKAGKVQEARVEASYGKITVPLVRGRLAGPRKLKRELKDMLPEEYARLASSTSSSRTMSLLPRSRTLSPSPLTTLIDAPEQYKYVEGCLTAVLDYTQNRFEITKWDPQTDSFGRDNWEMWQNKILTGHMMIKNGKVKDGFRLIDISLKSYKLLIQKEHPLLIIETYTTFLFLSLNRLDLAETILRYLVGLCRVCLGPVHPYTRIWSSLLSLGMEKLRGAAALVIKTQLAMLTTYFNHDATFLLNQRIDTARQACCFGSLPIQEAEADIEYAINLRRQKDPDLGESIVNYTCWAKGMLSYIYRYNKRYAEAQAILDEVGHYVHSGEVNDFSANEWYNMKCQVLNEIGTYEEIVRFHRERLDWNVKKVGLTHHWTMRTVVELDTVYGKRNDVVASKKLHEEFGFESNWDAIMEQEDIKAEPKEEGT